MEVNFKASESTRFETKQSYFVHKWNVQYSRKICYVFAGQAVKLTSHITALQSSQIFNGKVRKQARYSNFYYELLFTPLSFSPPSVSWISHEESKCVKIHSLNSTLTQAGRGRKWRQGNNYLFPNIFRHYCRCVILLKKTALPAPFFFITITDISISRRRLSTETNCRDSWHVT